MGVFIFLTVIGITLLLGILGYVANSNTEDEPIPIHRREVSEFHGNASSSSSVYFDSNNRIAALLKIVGYVFLASGFIAGLFFLVNGGFLGFFWMVLSGGISFILALGFSEVVQQLHHINIRLRKKEFLLDEEQAD